MDPITGIGLAASVIQLLTFSLDAVKTCQEIYQKGSVSDYQNLDYTTNHLAGLTNSLQQSLRSSSTGRGIPTGEEKDLVELARKCGECAQKLQKELDKLQTQPGASTLNSIRLTARAIRKKGTIDKISQHQRFDTQGLQSDKSFAKVDKSLQHIITCLANSRTSMNSLVRQQSAQTRHHITAQVDRVERLHIDDRRYEEIVDSLFYPDISSRQEQVDNLFDGVKKSYDWIFDKPQTHGLRSFDKGYSQQQECQWDDFARWLESGHGVYWINGKAGSGKSTLMNHICHHSRKLELLEQWCSERRLLTPTFFFWNAGTRLQKSIDGLLRSLFYQMLKECRELVPCFSPLHTWTQSRLLTTLHLLLKQSQIPIAICMFIDGLDEFEGQEDAVIKMIDDLADQTHVKVCVSSRPLLAFEEAFGGKPSLRLQDLTFDSTIEYGEVKLSEPIQKYVSLNICERYQAEALVHKIVARAHGVFLWAIIAIRDIHDGLRGMVDINELSQTLETLPSQIESLFMLMLHRIKPAFKRDAAYFLGFAIYQHSNDEYHTDLCTLYFSHSQRELKDRPAHYEDIATNELVTACHTLKIRLLSHTAGLLELTPSNERQRIYGRSEDHDPVLSMTINFLHRTARDFLLRNDKAKSFLASYGCSEAQICLSIARGTLAQAAHLSPCVDDGNVSPVFHPFLATILQISEAERTLCTAQTKLMQSLNYESLVGVYQEPAKDISRRTINSAFMIKGLCAASIDQVGMAAHWGMTRYVCEQLDLPVESSSHLSSFPNLNKYSRLERTTATLVWSEPAKSRNENTDIAMELRSSKYRQALGRCLQWMSDGEVSPQTVLPDNSLLAETYMLCCCDPRCFDLVRVLLRAGANPMVQVGPVEWSTENRRYSGMAKCFWENWLHFLLYLRSREADGVFQRSKSYNQNVEGNITLKVVFNITKALLANGADINYQLLLSDSQADYYLSRPQNPGLDPFLFWPTASAMFILEEVFNSEPEFRQFASEIDSLAKRPTRKIKAIQPSYKVYTIPELKSEEAKVYPSAEESDILWPLFEKCKDTGGRDDFGAFEAAVERIWRAHHPGVEFRKRRSGSSDYESTDSEDDDDVTDDGNDDEQDGER